MGIGDTMEKRNRGRLPAGGGEVPLVRQGDPRGRGVLRDAGRDALPGLSAAGGPGAAAAADAGCGRAPKTLRELSLEYRASGDLLRARLRLLRAEQRGTEDPDALFWLGRRIYALADALRQVNELTELTAHYYERGYCRNPKYTM